MGILSAEEAAIASGHDASVMAMRIVAESGGCSAQSV